MKIVVFTGAGMSAESGINTFRDKNGLWEGHDVMTVASPEGWRRNRELVLDFYNQRRKQLFEVVPNDGHIAIADLAQRHEVQVITQNVDDLHERAGSTSVIHLHGELRKVRSEVNPGYILDWDIDLHAHHTDEEGHALRPHIVWFGEEVPELERAAYEVADADRLLIVGTSLQVYPAAGLLAYAPEHCDIHYVDPNPQISYELAHRPDAFIYREKAAQALPDLLRGW